MSMQLITSHRVDTTGITSVILNDNGAWEGYTDLKLVISARITNTSGTNYSTAYHHINDAALNSGIQLYGTGSSAASHSVHYLYTGNNSSTANTFSNGEIYYANFASSSNKSIGTDWVNENNGTNTLHWMGAQTYASTSPITRIDYVQLVGEIAVGSTFTLYGITAGSDGITAVS